jgi:hypothetical protein
MLPVSPAKKEAIIAKFNQLCTRLEKTAETFKELEDLCNQSFVGLSREMLNELGRKLTPISATGWQCKVQSVKIQHELGDKRLLSKEKSPE